MLIISEFVTLLALSMTMVSILIGKVAKVLFLIFINMPNIQKILLGFQKCKKYITLKFDLH